METKLDPEQRKAVEHFEGPALVVAGPGSGKTMVIKERILHLIREHNADPSRVLALAFNKEAAKEMERRILSELGKNMLPEIRTLHAFGLRIINEHYDRLKWKNKPEVWASDPERTIKQEIQQLKRNLANVIVTIYKIESELTGKCYIGQTTNPDRRRGEHFSFEDSSNPGLRQAMLNEGQEHFNFYPIDKVEGKFANRREAEYIEYYRNCAVISLVEPEVEQLEVDKVETHISIYKIENKTTGVCYIIQSIDSERSKVEDFTNSSNEELRNVIENEGVDQFTFDILHKNVHSVESFILVERAIKNASSRSRAVFNRQNPLKQRYSDQLMIELFCEHFNICYEEFLKHPSKVENLAAKIEDFEKIVEKVQKAKQETNINFTSTSSINEIIHSIIESIDDPVVRAFAERYEKKKRKANAIDFQDMILYAVYLLEVYPDILDGYREKYDYVHIDEFQDVSPIDFRLTKPLSENLFVVGDDDQAIYGFRGGNSEIMLNFHKQGNVQEYKITRNYRSTSTIVEHSKILIEHNTFRISKNLHAKNPVRPPIKVLETKQETVKSTLLREFVEPICQTQFIDYRIPILENTLIEVRMETQKIGIPVRYRSEVEKLRQTFRSSGFTEIKGETRRKKGDPFKIIGRGKAEIIEGSTIHSMKGKEYDKIILIHNTLDEDFPFHDSDNITEERRVFYVAMTRAKHELLLIGGECQFVTEAGLSVITHKRKKRLEKKSEVLNTAIMHRIDLAKKIVDELSETMQAALISALTKQVKIAIGDAQKQCEYELSHLRDNVRETKRAAKKAAIQLETELPTDLKAANEALLQGLIPVLDTFESQINSLPVMVESNDEPDNFVAFTESVRRSHTQSLNLLKTHGLKPIEAVSKIFNPTYHEKVLPDIYSDEVQAGWIAKEERRGYLLHDRVIRKAQVVISKGENIRAPERLDRVVDIYLNRLIFAFQAKYELSNMDQSLVKREVVEYLLKLDDESLKEIVSFASKNKAETIQLKRYADYCVGQEKIHRCTGVFRNFWNKMWEVITTQNKNIRQADTLLNQDFVQPVRFVTYAGFRDLRNIETLNDGIKGLNSQGEEVQLQNLNVLFAFPKEDMAALKSHIKRRRIIANQNLQPIELMSERFQIANDLLELLLIKRDVIEVDDQNPIVRLVTRSGHVLNGYLWDFDEDFLYMKINSKDVIVYRSGLLRFVNLTWNEITKAYKDGDPIDGYVTKRIRDGFQVKFQSLIGFLPTAQVELYPVQHLDSYIGKTYEMKVIEVNEANNHFVLSRRAWLKEQNTELFKSLSEISEELPKLRNIQPVNKTVEAIPRTDGFPLDPEVERIPLDKSISVIVPEPVAEVIDTSLPISTGTTENPDTYIKDFKPETCETVEVRRDPLYESIDLIVPDPVKKMVDSRLPTSENFSEIPKNSDNVTQVPTLETSVDPETPVESAVLTRSDSSTEIDSDTHQINGRNPSENETEDAKKSLRYYLRRGGRFAVEKIKATIFKKPNS